MTTTRRALLRGAARVSAALAIGSAWADPFSLQTFCTSRGLRKAALRLPQPATVPMLHPDTLPRFVDPLPIPRVADAQMRPDPAHTGGLDSGHGVRNIPFHRIAMREAWSSVHRDLPPTRFWGYDGTMPGPTVEVRSGHPILIEWANELPQQHLLPIDHTLHGAGRELPFVRAVVHVHGSRVPPEADGYPDHWYVPGKSLTNRYPNRQDAATLWYHDHTMGIERLNVYAGLLGAFIVRDDAEQALHLPSGEFEIPLIIFDRQFTLDGQLYYPTSGIAQTPWVSEAYGDTILVNGKFAPYLQVEPCTYRFRVVNASNSRFYYLALSDGTPLQQIGSDQGLLQRPLARKDITLAPAERADIVIDFSKLAGQAITLRSQALQIMQFRVAAALGTIAEPTAMATTHGVAPAPGAATPRRKLPTTLRPIAPVPRSAAIRTRTLTLNNYEDPNTHMMMMLLNATYWRQPVTEIPVLGSVEIWEFVNLTDDTHPIHLHLVRFQVLNRQRFDVDEYLMSGKLLFVGAAVLASDNELGWKDTVQAHSGLITRIIIPFDGYPGRYVWHCHVLEHSANEMMRPFEVVAAPRSAG